MNGYEMIWLQIKNKINENLSDAEKDNQYMSFFAGTELVEFDENHAVITTPLNLNKIVLSNNIGLISNAFKEAFNKDIVCRVECDADYQQKMITDTMEKLLDDHLIDDYTFDNFVVGPSNMEAKTAAMACASSPAAPAYNPLVIYGNSGLGKTHLLNAIGNYIKDHDPDKRVLYISSINFVNEVIKSFKEDRTDEYKNQLNSVDVLLVDDIQTLSGKTKSNEVFFSVYNELFNNHKQIVLTSDRPPVEIKDIEDRLRTRFSQGLAVTINSPEFETAYKILELKLKNLGVDKNQYDEEAISFLASNFQNNVRDLEGALNRTLFYSINFAKSEKITFDVVMEAFKDQKVTFKEKNEITISDVTKAVADYYNLNKSQLVSKTRTKNIANARHIAMYMCRKVLDVSYIKIGDEFGGRDHSTVLSACEKIEGLVKTDPMYRRIVEDIEKSLSK